MYDPDDCADPDAPTVLSYARVPWLDLRDYDGSLLDDDCGDEPGGRHDPEQLDADQPVWGRPDDRDCGDGLPDDADWLARIADDLPF